MASFSIRGWQHTHHHCLGFLGWCVFDVSELWPTSARQKGGQWRCFGSAGGVEEAPLFHTPTSTTDILTTSLLLSSMGRRRKKDTFFPQLRTHTNQNEMKNKPSIPPLPPLIPRLPCNHHDRSPLLLLTDQYDTTISRRDIVNLSLPPFPSTAPTRPQPAPSVAVVVVGSRRHIPKPGPGRPQKTRRCRFRVQSPSGPSSSPPLNADLQHPRQPPVRRCPPFPASAK